MGRFEHAWVHQRLAHYFSEHVAVWASQEMAVRDLYYNRRAVQYLFLSLQTELSGCFSDAGRVS